MVLRAVKLVIQATLLLQVLHGSVSVNGLEVSENFQNTELTQKDRPATVVPADISDSDDQNIKNQEERGFFSWITGNDNEKTKAPATPATPEAEAPAAEGDLATTTPIPGTSFTRPSTSSFMSKFGSTLDDFTGESGSDDGAGSEAPTTKKPKRTKKPAVTSESASASASGSEAATPTTTKKTKRTKKPVVAASGSEDSESASGSEATTKKPTRKKTKKPVASSTSGSEDSASASGSEAPKKKTKKTKKPVATATSASEDASGSSLDDLLAGFSMSGSDDLSALLGSSAGSGSEADLSALLGSSAGSGSEDGGLAALLGGSLAKGSGSMLSFEDFMKEYGSMFGSGSSALDLFGGDPTQPMNNTVNDDDILLGELYGGKEHGDAFSDVKNIKFGQMILNITVRGQERVDQVGLMVMTQEAVGNLVHGGKGGTEGFIEPTMGDTIDSVEVHWDKNKGKTCIFYLKMTTSGKKTIATGTKTENSAVITPPKGYQIAGFHGRASSSGIFCIGGIFTKSSATDLIVTDVMAISSSGSEDIYNYKTTIRNWVGPLEAAGDNACYQKKFDVSSKGVCPSGFNKDDDQCVTQCPLNYPIDCLMECIPQNSDCTQEIISKVASVVAVALNAATLGVFGTLVAAYKAANFALTCAINVVNAVKSIIYYLRYKQTTIPQTDTEKLMDKAFQLQIAILDLPLAICACFNIPIPPKLQFSVTILAVVSAIVMMAVMVGEALFASSDNVMLMLRESGALNTTALDSKTIELDTFLNSKNGTCGYEVKTLTNRVMGKVYEVRNNTPNAAQNDVRVAVSKSTIITEDIPMVTNHCMGQIWTNKTGDSSYKTRNLLRKTLGVIIDQLIEDGTTDMGKSVTKKEKALEYANLGLFILSVFDPTGIAWMASEFVQPICGPTEYLGEIDDGTLYDALGLNTVDQAFLGSYGVWKKKGDGSVTIFFESVDKYDVKVVIKSGGDKLEEVKVPANSNVTWSSTVEAMQDKTLYLDRWRPGLLGLPGSGGGSLLLWIPRSSEGGQLTLHARLNVS
ncbi:Haustorium-specific membrane protein [Phytophthora megakarya]|uniref:Haustorium-specific membrane protein n=1 Tax=Phytophthora megakarya TaxID=4795 RepID=A0A225X185_9STRA|nr:Haustorium-specific membrane protein [Phytophthora megakarya]